MLDRPVVVLEKRAAVRGVAFACGIVREAVFRAGPVPAVEYARYVNAVGARHAVLAQVAGDRLVLEHELRRLFERVELSPVEGL